VPRNSHCETAVAGLRIASIATTRWQQLCCQSDGFPGHHQRRHAYQAPACLMMDLRVWQGFSLPSDLCLLQPRFHTVNNVAVRYSGYSTATITINHINIPRAAEYSRLRTIKLSLSLAPRSRTYLSALPRAIERQRYRTIRLALSLCDLRENLRFQHHVRSQCHAQHGRPINALHGHVPPDPL
jgi:hypothetical protein